MCLQATLYCFFWCISKSLLPFFHHQNTLLHVVMADSVVTFVLDHLAQLATREANLLYGVEDRVQSLQYELQMIKDLLNTTKREKGMEHTVLNQIRDVAHLAEDVIDTFVAKVVIYKRRTILGRMLHGFGQARLLHHVADKIDKLKTTLNEIRDNKDKYDAFKETTNQSAEEEEEKRLQSVHKLRRNVEEEDVVGFVKDSKDVIKRLLGDSSNRKVVSIVGMGGLGKTTLARKVYNSSQVNKHFDRWAWVYASNECIVRELLLALLKHLSNFEQQRRGNKKGNKSTEDVNRLSEEELKTQVRNCLEGERYLVVIDDLCNERDWNEVQDAFPENRGSRILITSRSKEVALHAGDDVPHYLQFLSEDESWELFCRKLFRGEDYPSDLEPLGKQMVQSCRGLPLSIIVLGGLLAKKEKSYREWSKVVGHVNWYLTRDETQVKDIVLELSYNNLPMRLKPCFLYLGLFPDEIPVTPLLQKWVAEGFIQDTGNRDPDDVAEDYLYELIDRSLVQVASVEFNGGLKTCQVHDLLRDLCISESKKDKVFEVCTDINTSIPTKSRRLSIYGDMFHYISSSNNDHSYIRSLFFFGPGYHVREREWKWLLDDFKLVRVLEFGLNSCQKIPSNLGNFIYLRYLRIDTMFDKIVPDSILNLWNLQTIEMGILWHNIPISFPIEMWKLKHLRHLNIRGPMMLRGRCSESYEKMWNLQTISPLVLNAQATSLINKGTFPNIKKMGLFVEANGSEGELLNLLQKLQQLKHLNKLVILPQVSRGFNPQQLVQNLRQFSSLTILMIDCVMDLLTSEVIFPPNIIELTLSGIKYINDEGMNGLGNHSNLKILRLLGDENQFHLNPIELNCVDGSFPQLKVLEIKELVLRKWKLGKGAMQRLQNLLINNCEKVEYFPTKLCSLKELRNVHVTGFPSEQMGNILRRLETKNGVQVVRKTNTTLDNEDHWFLFKYVLR